MFVSALMLFTEITLAIIACLLLSTIAVLLAQLVAIAVYCLIAATMAFRGVSVEAVLGILSAAIRKSNAPPKLVL